MDLGKMLEKFWMGFSGSWKTTIVGVIVLVSMVADQLKFITDGDPSTTADVWQLIVAVSAFLGFSFARDNDKKSEDVVK